MPEPADRFEESYRSGDPPWDIGRAQPEFATRDIYRGRVLDVGCGTGEHALLAAERGFDATGIDGAPTAIARARRKATDRGLQVRFIVGDVLHLGELGERFDTVIDCGVFHTFDDGDRARYVESLHAGVAPGGRCYVLCFSDREPGDWGPRRVKREEIFAAFARGWDVESIEPATMDVTFRGDAIAAWFAAIARR